MNGNVHMSYLFIKEKALNLLQRITVQYLYYPQFPSCLSL